MDDRLLALSRARDALRELGIETAAQFRDMDAATYERVAAHYGLVSGIVSGGHPDALAALWTAQSWRVVSLHPHDPHRLLYVGDEPWPLAAYDDENGKRRAWHQLMAKVAPIVLTPPGGGRHRALRQAARRLTDRRATALTPRGRAALVILRAQGLVRELDAADRAYLAPYAAELLVDLCADAPPA